MGLRHRALRSLPAAGVLGLIVFAWQVIEQHLNAGRVDRGLASLDVVVPRPNQIVASFYENLALIQTAMAATLLKAGLGSAIGATVAVSIAISYCLPPSLRTATMPLAYAFNSFPVFGLVPAIILAFGPDNAMSIAVIAALLSYFPILLTLDHALTNAPTEFRELAELSNCGRLRELWHIRLPIGLPALFIGLRLAVPGTIVGATVGELLGSRDGIGNLVSTSLYQLNPARMYAAFLEVAAVCSLFVVGLTLLEKAVVPWADPGAAQAVLPAQPERP